MTEATRYYPEYDELSDPGEEEQEEKETALEALTKNLKYNNLGNTTSQIGINNLFQQMQLMQTLPPHIMGLAKTVPPQGSQASKRPLTKDEELIWNVATLTDVLARIRQLEKLVSVLLLAGGIHVEEEEEKNEVDKHS